jgi:ribose 5-phosphate isomerase RpiB
MAVNGPARDAAAGAHVLRWPGRVLTAEALGECLNGYRELIVAPRTVVTPLAAEQLRANGVRLARQAIEERAEEKPRWGVAQERPQSVVASAIQALRREGIGLQELDPGGDASAAGWARAIAECVARGECRGGIVFCQDPGLVCCVANKLPGLRSVAVVTVTQAARATLTLGANLVAVEMPGRTYFEVRQILRILCTPGEPTCPPVVACTLQELDGHAHR